MTTPVFPRRAANVPKNRRLIDVAAIAMLILIGTPLLSRAAMPPDLKLRDAVPAKLFSPPQLNVHERKDACPVCHPDRKSTQRPPGPSLVTDEFLNDSYADTICEECHKGWIELHPSSVDVVKSRLKINVPPNVLPLRYLYQGRYKVVCMTCHDIHFPHNGFRLLRGYSLNPKTQPSRFTDRISFCRSCHGQEFENITPHQRQTRGLGCTLCHVRKPAEGRPQPLRANVNILCTYCHPIESEPHYLNFNPFPELDQEVIWKSGVSLRDGAYTCITCHQPHGASTYRAYLRESYIDLIRLAVQVNPHDTGPLCQICHVDPRLDGNSPRKPAPALIDKNANSLCTRCHAVGKVESMYHYLGEMTDKVKRPKNLPLSPDGKITCLTCHRPGCGTGSPDNPNFLREKTPTFRGFCKQCHDWSKLETRNIHVEFPKDKGCEVCHERQLQAGEDAAKKPGELRADQNFVCYQCHEPDPHPASHRHTVKPKRADYLKMDAATLPLDVYKRITCNTCHYVDQKVSQRQFLRGLNQGTGGSAICGYCHPY